MFSMAWLKHQLYCLNEERDIEMAADSLVCVSGPTKRTFGQGGCGQRIGICKRIQDTLDRGLHLSDWNL
jgi:hypothetical protein